MKIIAKVQEWDLNLSVPEPKTVQASIGLESIWA
jgi:hypothetical protein